MKKQSILFFMGLILGHISIRAQVKISPQQYIDKYAPTAVSEMERSGIPASITLAQGLLESDNGNSPLATIANNHFGIKCHKEWTGDTYYQDDDEKNECFRYYPNAQQSYIDHTDFLRTRSRYEFLFTLPKGDYVAWANGLKQAGYATNPNYPTLLINLISRYELNKYDALQSTDLAVVSTPQQVEEIKEETKTIVTKENISEEVVVPIQAFSGDIFLLNNIKTIIAKSGDTPMGVATKYNVPISYLYKYNDMHEGENFEVNQNIFLQPKRNKGYVKQHQVVVGESLLQIAQKYGIKLAELYKKNMLSFGDEVYPGEVIYLRDENPNQPKSMSYEEFIQLKNNQSKGKAIIKNTSAPKEVPKATSTLSSAQIESSIKAHQETTTETTTEVVTVVTETITKQESPVNNEKEEVPAGYSEKPVIKYEIRVGDTLYNLSKKFNVSVEQLTKWNNIENNYIKIGQTIIVNQ